jgi:ABC-2 type transport system ATP-binding protein
MDAIKVENMSKCYPHKNKKAVDQLSFQVKQGEFFGLLGPNGAGKSTTLNIISQLVQKDTGTVYVQGLNTDLEPFKAKSALGVIPQEFNFNVFETVEDIVLNQGGYYGFTHRELKRYCQFLLERLDLWRQRRDQARTLSGGMKRRLMIARGLIHQPKILILDEPSAGVDVELRRGMWDFLKEINQEGTTIILTSHYLEEIELLCREVGIINQGKLIVQTGVRELLAQSDKQVFLIELAQPYSHQALMYDELSLCQLDPSTLQFTKNHTQTLEKLFSYLYQKGVLIESVRPQHNRLEDLFIAMTKNQGDHHD